MWKFSEKAAILKYRRMKESLESIAINLGNSNEQKCEKVDIKRGS